MVNYDLIIDLARPTSQKILVKRGDDKSRTIRFTLITNGEKYKPDPLDVVSLRATLPKGEKVYASCNISEEGDISYTLTENMLTSVGQISAEVSVFTASGATINSFEFYIVVEANLYDEMDYVSDDDLAGVKDFVNKARVAALAAEASENTAGEYAETTQALTDIAVQAKDDALEAEAGAKRYAEEAEASAVSALASEQNAGTYSNVALLAKGAAETAKDVAIQQADAAGSFADNAEESVRLVNQAKAHIDNVANQVEANAEQSARDALSASTDAASAQSSALSASAYSQNAADSAEAAAKSAAEAAAVVGVQIATPEMAGIVKPDDETIEVSDDGTIRVKDLADYAKKTELEDYAKKETLADVATSGSYNDLEDAPNLATVATSGSYSDLVDAPNLATVATSGSYEDLADKPEIPTMPGIATTEQVGVIKPDGESTIVDADGTIHATGESTDPIEYEVYKNLPEDVRKANNYVVKNYPGLSVAELNDKVDQANATMQAEIDGVKSNLSWKLLKDTVGNEIIELPNDFSELRILVFLDRSADIVLSYNILKEELVTTDRIFRNGYYRLDNVNAEVMVASNSASMRLWGAYLNKANVITNTRIIVRYR